MKTALITGITGQDGAYLARHLLEHGYRVVGGIRRSSSRNLWRLEELGIVDRLELVGLEMLERSNLERVLKETRVGEVYNLAAQSFVSTSFEQPLYTAEVDAMGALRLLEAIRDVDPGIAFYQASTSEMFGAALQNPQNETTPFNPRSPYAFSKVFAHHATANYRIAYGLRAASGILFNHESPLRGLEFVTRKISAGLARWKTGEHVPLLLGNLSAKRDWGFAGDYVEAVHRILQAERPRDYVVATGGDAHRTRLRPGRGRGAVDRAALERRGAGGEGDRCGHGKDGGGGQRHLLPAVGSRCAHRRCRADRTGFGLAARDRVCGTGRDDGQSRFRPAAAGRTAAMSLPAVARP